MSSPASALQLENLLYEKKDGIAYVTLNRPKVLNALNAETWRDLQTAFETTRQDEEVRGVILTGGGDKAFIAGADISELSRMNAVEAEKSSSFGQAVLSLIEDLGKPVIAAVNGFALGGGCETAMACTIRIASESAKFGQPEVKLGVLPGGGGTQRLPRLVGRGRALQLILTGEIINAQEAFQLGIVNRVLPQAVFMEEIRKLAAQIAANGGVAVRLSKMVIDAGFNMDLAEACSLESYAFSLGFSTEDQKEGMTAFLEKRKPNFKGR